jgi:hypothetical protein
MAQEVETPMQDEPSRDDRDEGTDGGHSERTDPPGLKWAYDLEDLISEEIPKPQPDWRQVATWGRELATLADELAGRPSFGITLPTSAPEVVQVTQELEVLLANARKPRTDEKRENDVKRGLGQTGQEMHISAPHHCPASLPSSLGVPDSFLTLLPTRQL